MRHAAPASAVPESSLLTWAVEMIHELRVHQIELEMQNEELHRPQVKLRSRTTIVWYLKVFSTSDPSQILIEMQGPRGPPIR